MLKEQKELLASLRASEKTALKLLSKGVKITGVVRKLRDAGDELESRVRYIEKSAEAEKKPKTTPPPPPSEPPKEQSPAAQGA